MTRTLLQGVDLLITEEMPMNVRVDPDPSAAPIRGDTPDQSGGELPRVDPAHLIGHNVDKVDQLSSTTLLAFAETGAVLVSIAHTVLG